MNTEVAKVDPKEFGLEEVKATELTTGLGITLEERTPLIKEFEEVSKMDVETTDSKTFKELRLKIRNNRTKGIEKWHTTSKAYFLAGGRFVDAIKNKEVAINGQMETKLLEGEKHQERLEAERIIKLSESRAEEIRPFLHPEAQQPIDLGYMQDDVWSNYLLGAKASHDARIKAEEASEKARIEAERKAEEERKAAEAEAARIEAEKEDERKRIEKENARLKKEAEAKEKARLAELKAIQEKEEAAQKERERLAKIEADRQAEIEAERKANEDAEKAKLNAKIQAEKDAREKAEKEAEAKRKKLEVELKAKEDAEKAEKTRLAKIEADKKEALRKAALAPEKEKIQSWIDSIELPVIDINGFSTEGEAIKNVITEKFYAFKKWAESQKNYIE